MVADPQSVESWLSLVAQHKRIAEFASEDREATPQALFHVGIATECALKALIMRKERLNGWPSKAAREELYTHDLRKLAQIAGVSLSATDIHGPSWHVVLAWDRNQSYDPKRMPRKVARAWVEAAFGVNGAVTWIKKTLA